MAISAKLYLIIILSALLLGIRNYFQMRADKKRRQLRLVDLKPLINESHEARKTYESKLEDYKKKYGPLGGSDTPPGAP